MAFSSLFIRASENDPRERRAENHGEVREVRVLQAMQNEKRPARMLHARVRDALLHVKQPKDHKKPAQSPVETGGLNNSITGSEYGTDASKITGP